VVVQTIKEQLDELRIKRVDKKPLEVKSQVFRNIEGAESEIIAPRNLTLINELQNIYSNDTNTVSRIGRPRKSSFESSRKFSVRLVSKLNNYFLGLKSWKGQDLGKDSKRLIFLVTEHQIWERVLKNYCINMRKYISLIEKEIISTDIKSQTEIRMNDVYLIFGLYQIPLEEHARYFSEKEVRLIKLCVTYISNRKN
jgi:hypothetical protein